MRGQHLPYIVALKSPGRTLHDTVGRDHSLEGRALGADRERRARVALSLRSHKRARVSSGWYVAAMLSCSRVYEVELPERLIIWSLDRR